METPRPSRILRVLALLAVLLNAAFGYFYPFLPLRLEDMKTASGHYPNLFTPAPYVFAIWGLIYLSWILYAVYALLPSQRRNPVHDRLSGPLILANLLASAWIIEFTTGFLGISLLIIAVMLATAVLLYSRARRGSHSTRFVIPFSLFFGWITVATLANLDAVLASIGWRGGSLGEVAWTLVLIGVAALSGLVIGYRFRDFVYPLVIAWAVAGIGVKQHALPALASPAFLAAALLVVWSIVCGVRSLRPVRAA